MPPKQNPHIGGQVVQEQKAEAQKEQGDLGQDSRRRGGGHLAARHTQIPNPFRLPSHATELQLGAAAESDRRRQTDG